jgi:O-antigen/teichoic acid export membrane protein
LSTRSGEIDTTDGAESGRSGRGAVGYYALAALAGAIAVAKGVVYAKLLGGVGLGHYSLAILVATYAEFVCHLGLYPGLECYLPALYGAGRAREARDLRNLAAGFIVWSMAGLVAVAAVAAAVCGLEPIVRSVMVLSALLIGSLMLLGIGVQDLRSRRQTMWLGRVAVTKAALSLTLGALGAWIYGFTGALAAEIVVNLTLFTALVWLACEDFRLRTDEFRRLRPIMRTGVPLVLKNAMNHLALTLDRWCIVAVLGVAAFGQYSFAMLMVSAGLALHAAIWVHLGPQAAYAYGRDANIRAVVRSLDRFTAGTLLVFVLGAIPFSRVVDWAVPRYFAEYQEGGRLLPILYWGVCLQVVAQYEWVAMALKRTGLLMWTTLVTAAVTAALYGAGLALESSLTAFAWIFVGGRTLNVAGQFVSARAAARLGPLDAAVPDASIEPQRV